MGDRLLKIWIVTALASVCVFSAWAATSASALADGNRAPASATAGNQEVDKALDVKGQSRAFNRLAGAKGDREAIDFVQTRKDYRPEIEATEF